LFTLYTKHNSRLSKSSNLMKYIKPFDDIIFSKSIFIFFVNER
jgi:hypothetical protein